MCNAKEISSTIISQFGGQRSFAMIGVKSVVYGSNNDNTNLVYAGNIGDTFVDIQFKAKSAKINGKSPNTIRIVYNVNSDLYTMVFYRVHGMNVTELKTVDMLYSDMLKSTFVNNTKLYLSL